MAGPTGLIAPSDVVLLKVNAQWKYRGCTNSDLIRGLIQRILDHPDGFDGEVVIVENGQGRGNLSCATTRAYGGDSSAHANANDESHHFLYLVDKVFSDRRVSATLLDPIRGISIDGNDHARDGYGKFESVSYPCFTTAGGLADAEKGVLVGRVTKNEAETRVRDGNAGDFFNNVRLAVSRSELHFIAPALRSQTPERHLEVAVSGGSSLIWRAEMDVPWLSCVPSSGSESES